MFLWLMLSCCLLCIGRARWLVTSSTTSSDHPTPNPPPTPTYQAIATIEKGDDMGALLALSQLSSLLTGMPVLEAGSQQVQLVAEELNTWAAVASREKILLLMAQVGAGGAGTNGDGQVLRVVDVCGVSGYGGISALCCRRLHSRQPRHPPPSPEQYTNATTHRRRQIDEEHAELVARMMDLSPTEAMKRVRAALDATGGAGGGGAPGSS